jgi:hypothetical protein
MLNSEKKFRALRDKKNNILTLVLSEKKFWTKQKTISPPCKLNGRSLTDQDLLENAKLMLMTLMILGTGLKINTLNF